MKQIWKYPLQIITGKQTLSMPEGSQILSAQIQRGELVMWALVEPESETEQREFEIIMTGFDIDNNSYGLFYISTVQKNDLVFHIFEVVDGIDDL